MSDHKGASDGLPAEAIRTASDRETRTRILNSAATLLSVKGIGSTTLEDVRRASSTTESQLHQHFPDKIDLIRAVIDVQAQTVLAREVERLAGVRTFSGLRSWRDALIQSNMLHDGSYGCPLGALSAELSDRDEQSRTALARIFGDWQQLLVDTLTRLRDLGILRADADPYKLGTGLLAAVQGGYILAQSAHSSQPMADALDMALARIDSFVER